MRLRILLPVLAPIALASSLVASLCLACASSTHPNDDDGDDRAEARVVAERAFTANCLMCHGAELTTRQRLTPKQWTAEVEKMIGWGTPLPPEAKDGLIAFLSETYPVDRPSTEAERITPEAVAATDRQDTPTALTTATPPDPTRGAALFAQHCAICHGPTARGGEVGINLVGKPVLARPDDFHTTLNQGKRRMPSFAPLLDDQARSALLGWLRRQAP